MNLIPDSQAPQSHLTYRRNFLKSAMMGSALFFTSKGAFAEALSPTPPQTEGPFYPDTLPLDTDNDLLRINDATTPAIGEITWFSGRILDLSGNPVKNAEIEIWQCDAKGSYLHSRGANPRTKEGRDNGFQGFGRFLTASKGEYLFRTIKPVPYPGRTPHIHILVNHGGKRVLTTQCYIAGHEMNKGDGVLRNLKDKKAFDLLTAEWKPVAGSKTGEYTANFDIILGRTHNEDA